MSPIGYIPPSLTAWRGGGEGEKGGEGDRGGEDEEEDEADLSIDYLHHYPLPPLPTGPTPTSPLFVPPSPTPSTPPPLSPSPSAVGGVVNPMRRLATLSGVCVYCVWVRAALLMVQEVWWEGGYDVVSGVMYLVVSELVPVALMVQLVDAGGREEGRQEQEREGAYGRME